MKREERLIGKILLLTAFAVLCTGTLVLFRQPVIILGTKIILFSVKSCFPADGSFVTQQTQQVLQTTSVAPPTEKQTTQLVTTEAVTEKEQAISQEDFNAVDKDIAELMKEYEQVTKKHKKDGAISEYKYKNDGVTDKYGLVRVKNVNKTGIDIEEKLNEKADLKPVKDKPSVLIFHTHTTETYQILDRGFYEQGFMTRSNDPSKNMIRVGKEICEEIEKAGYKVIHDTTVYDTKYSGAYTRSRKGVEEYLEKYPTIQVVLDVHRDAIQQTDGTKIKPTVQAGKKKAAQIMIISGCQEEGNGITNLPDWKQNLTFAIQLQNKLEQLLEGITRPLYFCPRSYNMNLSHCSVLVEVGSDSNTLEEAVLSGRYIGKAVAELLDDYGG